MNLNLLSAPAIPLGQHAIDTGLYLRSKASGASYVFRYTATDGRRREMGMGRVVSGDVAVRVQQLSAVRQQAQQCREMLARGLDPIDSRKAARTDRKVQRLQQRSMTVRRVLRLWIDYTEPRRKWARKYAQQVAYRVEHDPPHWLLEVPVHELRALDVVRALGQMTVSQDRIDNMRQRLEWAIEWLISNETAAANAGAVRRNVRGRFRAAA